MHGPPRSFKTADDYPLSNWVTTQRQTKAELTAERVARLENLPGVGMESPMKLFISARPIVVRGLILLFIFPLAGLADISGRVVSVTDGDTIKVLDSANTEHKVRLTGIDAPERGQPLRQCLHKRISTGWWPVSR